MTDTGCVLGTPAYISPEVAVGQEADSRSDVYGLGGVLYYLLCGRPPFEAETAGALIFAHVHERPASPSSLLGRPIPADVESVVMRALEKDPAVRFATSAELALALSSCSLAGAWTFGDATGVARRSSRPPASGSHGGDAVAGRACSPERVGRPRGGPSPARHAEDGLTTSRKRHRPVASRVMPTRDPLGHETLGQVEASSRRFDRRAASPRRSP